MSPPSGRLRRAPRRSLGRRRRHFPEQPEPRIRYPLGVATQRTRRPSTQHVDGPLRAAIYVRISDDPTGLRAGVERQLADSLTLAEREAWQVVGTYEDNDRSAYSG